jgi:hypothetical protein
MFEETFTISENGTFNLSDIGLIIGAGGVISHAGRDRAFWMLAEGFRPYGVTCLAVDRDFRSPHLGVLSEIDRGEALRLFEEECLEKLGFVVAPFGDFREGDRVMSITDMDTGDKKEMNWGDVIYFGSGGSFRFNLESGASLGSADGQLTSDLPVLVDCRNMDEKRCTTVLSKAGIPQFGHEDAAVLETHIRPAGGGIEEGDWEIEKRLPYRGAIMVGPGDLVEPGSVLGENTYDPPRLYIIDLNKIPGYDRHLTPEEVHRGLLVGVGDRIRLNDPLFKVHRKGLTGFDFTFHSTVRGSVTRIEENGLIVVREIQDYDDKPHVVDVAGQLGIKPKHIGGYLKRSLGDFVEAGQTLASDISTGTARFVKSPTSGMIKDVDRKRGTVTVQFDIRPVRMISHVSGRVKEVVPDQMVTIEGSGARLQGIIGFGGETSGPLLEVGDLKAADPEPGSIVFTVHSLTSDFLSRCARLDVSGIVAPSIPASQWVEYNQDELGVAITGDEEIPFTVVLTEGFGGFPMNGETAAFLRRNLGRSACISGRTQIRAGVTRPMVIL